MIISQSERQRLKLEEDNFIYGEIECDTFLAIFKEIPINEHTIFYDLGSGSGKSLLTIALNFNLAKVVGVELLPGLCKLANTKIIEAKNIIKSLDINQYIVLKKRLATISIINADLLNINLLNCDIVFINATCFDYYFWEKIIRNLFNLKKNSYVVLASKKLSHAYFQLISTKNILMSFGYSTINIYKKIK